MEDDVRRLFPLRIGKLGRHAAHELVRVRLAAAADRASEARVGGGGDRHEEVEALAAAGLDEKRRFDDAEQLALRLEIREPARLRLADERVDEAVEARERPRRPRDRGRAR